jgi:hypothetical protein
MARTPNYSFDRMQREKAKAQKKAEKAEAKAKAKEAEKAAGQPADTAAEK